MADGRGSEDKIHHLRVELKRLRSLWRLARRAGMGAGSARQIALLREAGRSLAGTRERQVMARHLEKLLRIDIAASPPAANTARIESLLEKSRGLLPAPAAAGDEAGAWEKAVSKTYKRARAKIPRNARAGDGDFHAWRKAAKDLLYALQAWPAGPGGRARRWMEKLDRLQERLGLAQDMTMLEAALAREGNLKVTTLRKALRSAARKKKSAKRKSLAEAETVFKMKPKEFRKLARLPIR